MNIKHFFCCVFFLANGLAFANENDSGMVVLVDRVPINVNELDEREKRIAIDLYNRDKLNRRSNSAEHREQSRMWRSTRIESMSTNGYIVAPEQAVNALYPAFEDSLEDLAPELGYEPMSLKGTPFDGVPTAVWGKPEEGGGIHSILYQFDFPQLGKVYLSEFSYSTSPITSYAAVVQPFGNIIINGQLATLYVYKADSGEGYSQVEVAIDGRLLELTVLEALEPGNEKLQVFKDLASYLN